MATLQENSFYIKKRIINFTNSAGAGQQTMYSSPTDSNFLYAVFIPRKTLYTSNGLSQIAYCYNASLPSSLHLFSFTWDHNHGGPAPFWMTSLTFNSFGRISAQDLGLGNYPVMFSGEIVTSVQNGGGSHTTQIEVIEYYGRN